MNEDELTALEQNLGALPLPDQTVLIAQGEDAESWLDRQVSNRVSGLQRDEARYALALTAKGKIMSDMWIGRRGPEQLCLVVSRAAAEALAEHLDKHIIMEDVELVPTDLQVWTVQGPAAKALSGDLDGAELNWLRTDRITAGGVDVLIESDAANAQSEALLRLVREAGGQAVTEESFERIRIEQGRPHFGQDFTSEHYAQEAGLRDRALDFKKGCYTGQEVVTKLELRGKAARQLVQLELEETDQDLTGSEVTGSADEPPLGVVSSFAPGGPGRAPLALGILKAAKTPLGAQLRVAHVPATVRAVPGQKPAAPSPAAPKP